MAYAPKSAVIFDGAKTFDKIPRRGVGRPRVLEEHQRRERILDAACDAIGQHGFHAMSMDKVASASGMSKKTIYEVFPSKQNLFEAAIEDRLFCFSRPISNYTGTIDNQLTAQLVDIACTILSEDRLNLMRAIISEIPKSEEIRDFFSRILERKAENKTLSRWFDIQKEAGLIEIDDATEAARYVFGMTVGELIMSALTECYEEMTEAQREAYIRKGVTIFLRGVGCKVPTNKDPATRTGQMISATLKQHPYMP